MILQSAIRNPQFEAPQFTNPTIQPSSGPPACVLVVDDTLANLQLLAGFLKDRGYRVCLAPSGKLALQAVQTDPPDLILLDINMPEMNGYEVCQRLKADPATADIPVIFISALTEMTDKMHAFAVGGVDYVTKPFQFKEVEARVATHLELRRQKRELQASYARLQELEHLRDSLVHMVVHDLRSPLSVMLMGIRMLGTSPLAQDPDSKDILQTACSCANTLEKMVTQLLDVSRLEAGQMPLAKKECDLAQIAQTALASLGALASGRQVSLSLSATEPVPAVCDPDLIRRVIENLLGNALKFSPATGAVQLAVTREGLNARIAVSDHGRGILPEYHQKIFEKFGQVECREKRLGTGLGLAFCKLAVEAHGGRIGVESTVGQGSTFWFELPGH
ncbi:MAG: hybrid sensor histidine kinase/response regulator [Verrucomicrobiota bacterium]